MSEVNLWEIENAYFEKGIEIICGVDEAGRGPWAGPVCAAAVILPKGLEIPGLNDSKKLTVSHITQTSQYITYERRFIKRFWRKVAGKRSMLHFEIRLIHCLHPPSYNHQRKWQPPDAVLPQPAWIPTPSRNENDPLPFQPPVFLIPSDDLPKN